jgi:dipeptidyl aminopeptidase/acylaminoacyl peptidase
MPLADAAKLFGARESVWSPDLSPSGRKISFLSAGPGPTTVAKILDLDTGKASNVIASQGRPENLDWCDFASEGQLVCRYGGNITYEGILIGMARLVTLGADGTNVKELGARRGYDGYMRQFDGTIIDWLPEEDGSILMARNYVPQENNITTRITSKSTGLGVDRINLASMKVSVVEQPKQQISRYLSDGHGNVRVMGMAENVDGVLTGLTRFRYRPVGERNWRELGQYDDRDGSGMWPVAVDRRSNSLYFLERLDGRYALYRMTLADGGSKILVGKHDKVDIDGVVRLGEEHPVIGYSYTDDRSRTVYFDQEHQKLAAALAKALPATPLIRFVSSSRDGKTLLVHASSDTDPGVYYLLDRASKKLEVIMVSREELEGRQLAPVQSISYRSSDGSMIPAYLTMSKDGLAKGRPAVVLPHGGPSARDEWGFDWLAQFLAARGYAVIQPNYRGSAGYGEKFMGENAFRDWKTAMSDIGDAARHLIDQGIADPNRLAIVGWSYGGYAALQSAAISPDRYRAVVAIAPVTDLSMLKSDSQGFSDEKLTKQMIGSGDHVRAGSPLQNVASLKAPILLVHGDLDTNVRSIHSLKMVDALKASGKPVEMLRYPQLDHYLEDSNARIEMLTKIGELLDRTIGK